MFNTSKRMLSFLLALVMVIGLIPVTHAGAAENLTPPVMEPDDSSWDIPRSEMSVSCGDYERDGGSSEGPANLAVDDNNATMWHTDWEGTSRDKHWFQFQINGDYTVCGLRYLPRQTGNSNGTITQYEIRVSDDGVNFRSVDTGYWADNSSWKLSQFDGVKVKYVRLYSLNAVSDNAWVFASAAEIRLVYLPTEVSDADKTALNALIAECQVINGDNYTARTWQKFQKALEAARTISANVYASQAQVDAAYQALAQAKANLKEKVEGEQIEKIFHLDSGRKYFSKDWTIALLNELSAAGYTHLQLAFGNNGMRFLLDDMTIQANGTTYASDDIKEGIRIGNYNYGALTGYYDTGAHALTQAEMDEIIAHGKAVGVEIIPHLNMPGHMSALLDAMDHIGITNAHFTGRVQSDSSVNLNNESALNFMFALTDKYAEYFADRGCKYFHIGADEYANDAYNGSMGFPSMGATLYQKFADFVNQNAEIVKGHGMIPRAWNDGIYYGSYTSEFDSDIEVNYWSSGWGGYTLAKASTLDGKGHGLINTNGDYYYILGKDDRFTPGSTSQHNPNLYTECAGYDLNRFMDGSVIENPVGGMFCVWADYPGRETEQQVGAAIRLVLRAMAMRMDGLDIDDLDTSVVPGGFNEDGSINESEVHRHTFNQTNTDAQYLATSADCENAATYYYSCECGVKGTETFEFGTAPGHTDVNPADHICDTCNKPLGECADADNDHNCDICGAKLSECADDDDDHNCDICGAKLTDCADADNDHNCDVCGTKLSDCADADDDHNCDTCGDKLSECTDTDKDHNCDLCGETLTECADNNDHKCDICGKVLSVCGDNDQDGKCDICGAITVPAKPYKITNVVSGVHVYWKAVPGATKYGLWRSETGKDGTYKWIANPTVPHFTDTKVESGKTYHYKVTTMVGTQHSAKSDAIGVIYVGTPDIITRFNKAAGITVGWDEIEGATGYAIYRKSYDGDDAWVRVATIEGNETFTWQDTEVKDNNGTVYRYTVRALAGKDMKTLSGCRNVGRTMARLTSRVLNSAVKASATSIKCSWTTTKEATGYEVRFMVGSTVYKTFTIGNYATGVKTFTGLQAGQTYKIQVRSYLKVDGMGFYSAWSTAKTVTLP